MQVIWENAINIPYFTAFPKYLLNMYFVYSYFTKIDQAPHNSMILMTESSSDPGLTYVYQQLW